MPERLIVVHRPEMMGYTFHEIIETDSGRFVRTPTKLEPLAPGVVTPEVYFLAENLVPQLLSQLGMPLTDQHLLEALAYERRRVDRVLDKYLNP